MRKIFFKILKYTSLFLFYLLMSFFLCGCTHDMSRREIDDIDMVLVLGIDYSDGQYTLSGLYTGGSGGGSSGKGSGGSGQSSSQGSGQSSEQVAVGTGSSAYAALENLKLNNKKSISLAQTGSFLIGEGAAQEGLVKCLDFLSRDETIKMEALIYIIQGQKASDFVNAGIEKQQTIHTNLEAIKEKQQENLTRNDNTVVNIFNDMKQTYSSVLIPYLIAGESGYLINGYAVFNNLKLQDYLDRETSDGVNFIRNIMRSYPIYLDNMIGLSVSYTKTKLKAHLEDKQITVTIKVSFETMVKEVLAEGDIFNRDELDQLTKKQNDYIQGILEKPVSYSKKNGLDILNLARLVENQNFTEWKGIKADWAKLIPDIKYEYELESKISKSFILGHE